jgi:hypothetical protein
MSKSSEGSLHRVESLMPYALFCQDSKISRTFATESDVWKHASENGLVVDMSSDEESLSPKRVLDKGYTIRECVADPAEKHDPGATDVVLPQPS